MYRLIDNKGQVIFESHFEMDGIPVPLSDNSFYRFVVCPNCCDIRSKVYKNGRLIKDQYIKYGESKSFSFRTGIGDNFDIVNEKICEPVCEASVDKIEDIVYCIN